MSDQDRQRYEAAERAARSHGEEAVVNRYGTGTTGTWAVKSLLIAVVAAIVGYFLNGWATAALIGLIWFGTSVAMRAYAMRLKRRPEQDTRLPNA